MIMKRFSSPNSFFPRLNYYCYFVSSFLLFSSTALANEAEFLMGPDPLSSSSSPLSFFDLMEEEEEEEAKSKMIDPSETTEKLVTTQPKATDSSKLVSKPNVPLLKESKKDQSGAIASTRPTLLSAEALQEKAASENLLKTSQETRYSEPQAKAFDEPQVVATQTLSSSEKVAHDVPQYFQGVLKSSQSSLFSPPPYPYQIVSREGQRLAYIDAKELIINRPLDAYLEKLVTVYGKIKKLKSGSHLVIRAQLLQN